MTSVTNSRPVVLCVLDGWGYREDEEDNAIARARTPVFDRLGQGCPRALLATSGNAVGLPDGQMGNSEVGHLNLGAGRIVAQEIRRIDAAIADGSLGRNPALAAFTARLRETGGTCHLMGLVSPGGVHSHQGHLASLARSLDGDGVAVAIHAFLDGRDTPPASALDFVSEFLADIGGLRRTRIASVCGRYYAMDRDRRWERTALAYETLVSADGDTAGDAPAAIRASYERETTDEFFRPVPIGDFSGMEDGDGVLMANFRADRARQILTALLDPGFDGFARLRVVRFAAALGMVEYSDALNGFLSTLFPAFRLDNILGGIVSDAGLRQLRIAETEKYAHVTFFFNGGVETPFPREDRILIPSPRVATYDLQPEMSADEVTDRLVEAIGSGSFDFILVNYANPDMVGHTGKLEAATAAIETVDRCIGRLEAAVRAAGASLLITADHGNAETMRDAATGQPHTAHTLNRVPALLVNPPNEVESMSDGTLADVAPTLLALLGLPQPAEMTGRSLLEPAASGRPATHARVSA